MNRRSERRVLLGLQHSVITDFVESAQARRPSEVADAVERVPLEAEPSGYLGSSSLSFALVLAGQYFRSVRIALRRAW